MKSLPRFECLIRAMCVHIPKDPDMMDTPLSGSRMASGARSDPGLSFCDTWLGPSEEQALGSRGDPGLGDGGRGGSKGWKGTSRVLDLSAWKGFVGINYGSTDILEDRLCCQDLTVCSRIFSFQSKLVGVGRQWYLPCT